MTHILKLSAIVTALSLITACTRIETGEVGVRVGFDKQVQQGELMPGTFNQKIIGSVITFPIKDVSVKVENLTPLAKDNSTMKDFDVTVIYNINPTAVSELYSTKNHSFHEIQDDDTYLMYNYIYNATRNAAYKAAREHEALDMNDQRSVIESSMKEIIIKTLADEKLDGSITISQVLVRQMTPADSVVQSANDLVRAKNEFKQKEVEVQTAKKEAERMQALSNQGSQSIAYMNAQATLNISEGIKNGKVQTIVVPSNMTGLMIGK
jgi:regulator of protease activity HflC (stomatin/prohibitin superfamily)